MKINFKKIIRRLFLTANIFCILFLLMGDLALITDPTKWWVIGLAGLAFPIVLVCTGCFFICWLFFNRKIALLSFAALLISIPGIKVCFAFNLRSDFSNTKEAGNLRIITWNVGLMNLEAKDSTTRANNNATILNSIHDLNADVVCLQEFLTSLMPREQFNMLDSIVYHSKFPYHYISFSDKMPEGYFHMGTVIFSKYPIIDSSKTFFAEPFHGTVLKTGILVGADTVDIFTTRLQSVHFGKNDYETIKNLKKGSENDLADTKNIVRKLKYGYAQRSVQVDQVKQLLNTSTRPVVFTGDMNDVPSSHTYSVIKKGMSDAWLQQGSGAGRTFRFISPTLRIDYIFFNDRFTCIQTKRIITHASDHYGLVTDLQFKK